jgi:hypothetical protein
MEKEYWLIDKEIKHSMRLLGCDFSGFIKTLEGEDITSKRKELCKELVGKTVLYYPPYCNEKPTKYEVIYDYPCLKCDWEAAYFNTYYKACFHTATFSSCEVKKTNNGTKLYKSGKLLAELEDKEYTEEELKKLIEIGEVKIKNKNADKLAKSTDLRDRLVSELSSKYDSRIYNAGTGVRGVGVKFKYTTIYFYIDKTILVICTNSLAHGPFYNVDLADPKNDPVELMEEIIESYIKIEEIIGKKWTEKE